MSLASCLLVLGTAKAQQNIECTYGESTWKNSNDLVVLINDDSSDKPLRISNVYYGGVIIQNGVVRLTDNGTLGKSSIFLGPNGTIDLGGTTQTISSLTLENGSKIINGTIKIIDLGSFNTALGTPSPNDNFPIQDYLNFDEIPLQDGVFNLEGSEILVPSMNFNNGGQILNGTLIIDSAATNNAWIDQSIEPPTF